MVLQMWQYLFWANQLSFDVFNTDVTWGDIGHIEAFIRNDRISNECLYVSYVPLCDICVYRNLSEDRTNFSS
jgi:hypothetical protein